jgi:hypothetical protein
VTQRRPRSPAIPGTPRDRTGAAGIERRAIGEISRRFDGLREEVLAIFDGIRTISVNDDAQIIRTIYALTPEEMASVSYALQAALDRWIASGKEAASVFWWSAFDEEAAHLGTAQSVANLTALSSAYASARDLQQIVFSLPYRNRVAVAQIKSYDHWTGLAAGMRATLSQIIGQAMVDGKNPRAVRDDIAAALDVSKAKAAQYAQTDITDTLRQARWAESEHAAETLGIRTGLLWTSALLPTTRPTHAARNGKVYTPQQCRDFYEVDGNRYNCFLPGTPVRGRFSAGIKSHYQGPALRLVTAGGRQLAVTPNHPVLTARGMIAAAEISEGDQLVAYRGQFEAPLGVGALNGGLIGTAIEQVFGALVQSGHQSTARVRPVDLHGDASRVDPDVDVVRSDRELVFAFDTSASKFLDNLALVLADSSASRGRPPELLVQAHLADAPDEVRRSGIGLALVDGELAHAKLLGSGSVAELDAARDEEARQAGAFDSAVARESEHRLAGVVAFDEVRDIRRFHYDGPVFDLQERSGLMLARNIVVSNCHCGQTEALLDDEGKPILSQALRDTMAAELARWKKHQEEQSP